MKQIDNTPIEDLNIDWGDPDGTGKKAKSLEQVQKFIKEKLMGLGYTFAGIATPSTQPSNVKAEDKIYYFAVEEGNYEKFGLGNITELSIIKSNGGGWIVESLRVTLGISSEKTFILERRGNPSGILIGGFQTDWDSIYVDGSYRRTLPIPVTKTSMCYYSGTVRSTLMHGILVFDRNKNLIKSLLNGTGTDVSYSEEKVELPLNAAYVIANSTSDISPYVEIVDFASKYARYKDLDAILPKIFEPVEFTAISGNNRLSFTGTIKTSSSGFVSEPIIIDKEKRYYLQTKVDNNRAGISYYDASGNCLGSDLWTDTSGFSVLEKLLNIPESADTMRVCGVSLSSTMLSTYEWGILSSKSDVEEVKSDVEEVKSDVEGIKSDVERVFTEQENVSEVLTTLFDGYWSAMSGAKFTDTTRNSTEKIEVSCGEKYLITTKIGGSTAIAYLAQWSNDIWQGVAEGFTAGSGNAVDKEYIVPEGVTHIAVCSYNTTAPTIKKNSSVSELNVYTKKEVDDKFSSITKNSVFGVRWKSDDMNDLGERCYDATGLSSSIGIGATAGHSDFDNIYPWSEIKRCNIRVNDNGAKIVTYEGQDKFTLDGSNGDVFVRIPKFKVQAFKKDGYDYRTVSEHIGYVHPAFVENGIELDEIFIAAFEASTFGNPYDSSSGDGKLYSLANVIPANNIGGQSFLDMAKSKGEQYSLYDMRCVDMLWTLMSVEYGCRNSNRIIGYGYADYIQAATYQTWSVVTLSANNTNAVTLGKPYSNSNRVYILNCFAAGNNICICRGEQKNIIAERKIVSVACASTSDNITIKFDGAPIDVDTTCFVGNAPATCNHCETISDTDAALYWHTGRTKRTLISGAGTDEEAYNVCRYRWIENPVGNVWHFIPDISFNGLQMYVCRNMKSYQMCKIDGDYKPVAELLPEQNSNGEKSDVNSSEKPNYWVTSLIDDTFAKGVAFGSTFDEVHDGSITSTKGFGGYYYLGNNNVCIVNGGGFDHLWRCNILTHRAWISSTSKWYLYGARLMFKNI